MADQYTTYWGLVQPEVGASRDSWGGKLNADLQNIDLILAAMMPIGAMIGFAGATAPLGWLLCDGTQYLISAYPKLFAQIRNRWGGDGVTYFAVPDSRARMEVGVGTTIDMQGNTIGYTIAEKTGTAYQTITQAMLPNYYLPVVGDGAHQHTGVTDAQGLHSHGGVTNVAGAHAHNAPTGTQGFAGAGAFGAWVWPPGFNGYTTDSQGDHQHGIATDQQGSHAHNVTTYAGQGAHTHQVALGGSGQQMLLLNPSYAATKIICCGPPSFTTYEPPASLSGRRRLPRRGRH